MNKSFGYYVTRYFGEYLPKQKGVSDNTIKSYRDTFVQMIEFFSLTYSININKLSLSDMSKERIEKFLKYLEETRHVCASTRNQRLAAVHAFFRYLQKQELAYFELCNTILLIEFKKVSAPIINYMSIEETSFLFLLPDSKSSQGFRDLAILTLLYETGARVQELLDLRLKNISLNQCPTVTLHGKGNKTRIVPIGKDMVSILRKYISDTGINNPEDILFANKQHKALTRAGVQYIIDKYVDKGRGIRSDYFKGKITNHSFRHSKSMHLLESGVNLVYIRDFLGHISVTTTEIYAKANAEIKRKVIEQHCAELKVKPIYNTKDKENLLQWLKNNI